VPRVVATGLIFIVMTGGAIGVSRLAASPVSDQGRRFAHSLLQYRDELNLSISQARTSLDANLLPEFRPTVDTAIEQAGNSLIRVLGRVVRTTAEWLSHAFEIVLICRFSNKSSWGSSRRQRGPRFSGRPSSLIVFWQPTFSGSLS
jgi:predicted PurR-regulated permease PerM